MVLSRDVGVVLDSFGQPVKQALRSAAELGFRQIDLPVLNNELSPSQLSRTGRREVAHYVRGMRIALAGLSADPGGRRFADRHASDKHLAELKPILVMAAEMDVPLVSVQLGRLDDPHFTEDWWLEIGREMAGWAVQTSRFVALGCSGDFGDKLATLLGKIGCDLLGACYDPAQHLLEGRDPLAGLPAVAGRIWMARARDGLSGGTDTAGQEAPIGEGEVDWEAYLAALDQAGYRGGPFICLSGNLRTVQQVQAAKDRLDGNLR